MMFTFGRLEHLCSFKAKITQRINFGETPLGKRTDIHFEGDLTGGILSGRMKGIDYLLTRSDGVSEINVRASIATVDGINISVQIFGYYDGELIEDNAVKLLTGHEKYKWLGNKVIVGRGKGTKEGLEVDYFYQS